MIIQKNIKYNSTGPVFLQEGEIHPPPVFSAPATTRETADLDGNHRVDGSEGELLQAFLFFYRPEGEGEAEKGTLLEKRLDADGDSAVDPQEREESFTGSFPISFSSPIPPILWPLWGIPLHPESPAT